MPTRTHLVKLAQTLRQRLGGQPYLTIDRGEVTALLRDISGEPTTRIKAVMGADLERALLEQGVRCFPELSRTTAQDTLRLFHAGEVLAWFIDMLLYPDPDTDNQLNVVMRMLQQGAPVELTPTAPPVDVQDTVPGRPEITVPVRPETRRQPEPRWEEGHQPVGFTGSRFERPPRPRKPPPKATAQVVPQDERP
ncbi:hypothetical protein ABGB17_17620 [Sphaerisporangium sp. B11E5]|uniref:hypothetical protein n=1 Tax=Sphaerisporangium sp. B11E5 TaxID=3153563 RepID=UPI00325EAB45